MNYNVYLKTFMYIFNCFSWELLWLITLRILNCHIIDMICKNCLARGRVPYFLPRKVRLCILAAFFYILFQYFNTISCVYTDFILGAVWKLIKTVNCKDKISWCWWIFFLMFQQWVIALMFRKVHRLVQINFFKVKIYIYIHISTL